MKRPNAKKVAVSLTVAQWRLVTEACSEWSTICGYDAEMLNGESVQSTKKRGEKILDIGTSIGVQVGVKTGALE